MHKLQITREYNSIKSVYNPYFNCEVIFGSSGLNHIFKSKGKDREIVDITERAQLISQGVSFLATKFPPTEFARRDYTKSNLRVEFYSFIYAFTNDLGEDYRLKIVVRSKSKDWFEFYSIFKIPHFRHKKIPQ
jgi:hypothetical protein